jgi:hypothetical protein
MVPAICREATLHPVLQVALPEGTPGLVTVPEEAAAFAGLPGEHPTAFLPFWAGAAGCLPHDPAGRREDLPVQERDFSRVPGLRWENPEEPAPLSLHS